MARVALAAFILGAVVTGALFKFLESRRENGPSPQTVTPDVPPSPTSPDADAEALRLRTSLIEANARLEILQKENAALKAVSPPLPVTAAGRSASWKAIREKLLEARKDRNRFWDSNDPGSQDLMYEFQSLMRETATRQGIDLDELALAPDGLPALAAEFLESLDPPLDEAKRAQIRQAIDEQRADWDEYLRTRASLTKMEEDRELSRMWDELDAGICGAISDEQSGAWSDLTGYWGTAAPASFYGGYSSLPFNSLEDAARECSSTWGEDLGLDVAQTFSLRPFVEEYVRELELLHADEAARGVESTPVEALRELMIRIQKKISGSLTLTKEQAEALRNWTRIEEIEVK